MKNISKKIKDTQNSMLETRKDDSVRLRKKAEELISQANIDVKFLLETKEKLIKELDNINLKLIKTNGALHILKILLEDK